ncbi:MAG: Gfo/Idh/MocA family oxidoreductase [Candidatus Brockarchaeota archaeon]|nr:Gfo/Idh/MocA family oxidoreductase [Candidatus Brockarchaeota archaeon]
MRTVKIGVIGAGSHANSVHYPSLSIIEGVEVKAVCDLNEDRLRTTAEKYSIPSQYTDYRKMLEKEELDAIYLIMPPHQLYDIAVDCLKNGLNLFIEKPPGLTRSQTESLAWYAERHGCKTMVGFNRRFIPLMRRVKEIVEKRGPINQCVSVFYKNIISQEPPYYSGAVDVLTSDVIHAVDTLRWMGGSDVERVCSSVRRLFVPYDNSFNAMVSFKNGALGFLMSNWAAGSRVHVFEMHSKGISAFINPNDKALIYRDGLPEPEEISTFEAAGGITEFHVYYGFLAENMHFIRCIMEDREPETCFRDAVKTMELIEKIYENTLRQQRASG